jgi:hypothetical protein
MAHGNVSDLVFLCIVAIVVQLLGFPQTLYAELGPFGPVAFKPQFRAQTADMDAITKFAGVLLLMIGLTFSGVRWNPANGKMCGLAGIITHGYMAYAAFKADGDVFVPRVMYAYIAVLLLGFLHIFAFPSNPVVAKEVKSGEEVKNNHGNSSDLIALLLMAAAFGGLFYADHLFQDFGPIKAQFTAKSADLSVMIFWVSSMMLVIAMMLSGVKWNPINGKMAGFGGFIAAGYTAYSTFKADSDVFVPRAFYVYAALIFLGAVHIFLFPSNPLIVKDDAKKDK